MKKILCILVILCVLLCIGLKINYHKKDNAVQEPTILPVTVNVQKMQSIPLVLSHAFIGSVIPIHSVEIRPFISGFIDEVNVKGGDFVTENQSLFLLEQSQYIAQLDLQMANVVSASADFENAKTYYERLQNAGDQAVSQSDLDAAKAKFLTTEAAVGAAVAQYDAAQVMYNYTFINAPISGVLGNVTITKGQYVGPQGTPLAYLVQTTPMRVVFSVPNTIYLEEKAKNPDNLFADKKIRLRLADGHIYDVTGKVQFLDNTISPATDSVQVFADFENINHVLLPNSYVDVLVEENIPKALVIPQKIISMKQDGYFVWVVGTDGLLHEKQIQISEQVVDKGFYYVTEGLEEGDFVVMQKPAQTDIKAPVQMKMEKMQLPIMYSVNPKNGENS
ncbi:MAG: efflux RND transporter periplasmic adaptor subunit [Alphaproteobacteria bacterium]|nr:efflux RND transporter periplasmic adaptor subunit [Alphaproteobacteria bacterium]